MTLHWTCGSRRTAGGGGKPTPTSLISQTLGVLDEASADAIRAEGERVTGERPWPTGLGELAAALRLGAALAAARLGAA